MPNQVWSATPDGQLDWLNDQVLSYAGLLFEDLAGSKWAQMVHLDDIDAASTRWAEALSSSTMYETEFRLRRADGAYRWHIARAVRSRIVSGPPYGGSVLTPTSNGRRRVRRTEASCWRARASHQEHHGDGGGDCRPAFWTATKEEARNNFDARLFALSQADGLLTASSWSGASMATVVEGALAPYRTGEEEFAWADLKWNSFQSRRSRWRCHCTSCRRTPRNTGHCRCQGERYT